MLAELDENAARGEIATIYGEIRDTTHVPYVSSLQRHLATRPGWLEWAWSVVGDGFRSGALPAQVWERADGLAVPALPRSTPDVLMSLGVNEDDTCSIRNVLDSFIRVSPTNLGFSGVVRRLLVDPDAVQIPRTRSLETVDNVPATLDPLPPLVNFDRLSPHEQRVLMQMATRVDGEVFIPGLYRMLAHWPAWFAHAVTCLEAARDQADVACAALTARMDDVVPEFLEALPLSRPPAAGADGHERIVSAIDRYRVTSPQMVVYCRMLRDTLPDIPDL